MKLFLSLFDDYSDMFLWPNVSAALYAKKVLQAD